MFKKVLNAKNITFFIIVLIALFLLPQITGILLLFFTGFVIAAALEPYVDKLVDKKIKRPLATAIVVISSIISIVVLFIPIFVMAYREIHAFVNMLPAKIALLTNFLIHLRINGQSLRQMIDLNSVIGSSTNVAQTVFNQSLNFTIGFAQACIIGIAVTMIVFYFLVDIKYIKEKFLEFFPPDLKSKASDILDTIRNKVGNYVRAQVLSMIAVGLMVTVALLVLRIDYPLLLGLISGILDIIPILGPTVALVVIALVAYPLGITKVVLVVVLFILAQQLSNYVIRPLLFGKFMKLHPLMIFFALFVAQQFLGVWGVIISPAIAATICVLIDEIYLIPMNKGQDAK